MTGDDDSKPRRPPRGLTGEDRELWRHMTRGVSPIAGKRRVSAHAADDNGEPAGTAAPPPVANHTTREKRPAALPKPPAAAKKPAAASSAPLPTTLDRRKSRRLAKGHERIAARIDLHGMRQSEAHIALRGFLLRCYADGLRHVLVITGKGTAASPHEDWSMGERERGVLRRNVPRWLAEPDLAAVVTANAPAHARHGGDGALYITLRSARRRQRRDAE